MPRGEARSYRIMSRGSTPPARPARDAEQAARAAGLHYVSDQLPGISRRRCGRGFIYQSAAGRRLRRAGELTRIARLGIPPAYQDVWICPDARGHLQATGRDARGRKQYRYHPRWQQVRGNERFARMIAFGAALPLLRRQIRQDMAREGLPRRKVLATVAWLLDGTRGRIGNAAYARDNQSFGITTLQNRHVSFVRGGGRRTELSRQGRRAARDRRGPQAPGADRTSVPGTSRSASVSVSGTARLMPPHRFRRRQPLPQEVPAGGFHCQGFPHLECHPALRGAAGRHANPGPARRAQRRASIARVVRRVARELRNTPAVCRRSYLDPDLFAAWRSGAVHRDFRHFLCARLRPGRSADIAFSEAARARRRRQGRAHRLRRTQTGPAPSARLRYPKAPRYETVRASAAAPPT